MAVLLTFGLLAQGVLIGRDWVAATWPASQAPLQQLCKPLGCQVQPLRRIESLVLDSSALRRRQAGQYVLEAVVRNTARQVVAAPALELTLLDANEAVLVRRVLRPQDWPQAPVTLAARSDWPLSLELILDDAQAQAMTGYRALIFYP